MPDWLPLGAHRYHVQDDVFVMEGHGEISLTDVKKLFEVCWTVGEEYGYWLVLFDASAGASMSAQARRFTAEAGQAPKGLSSTAIYGATMLERTFVVLIRNAIKLMRGAEMPIEVFKSSPDAMRWLDEQRRIHRAAVGRHAAASSGSSIRALKPDR